MGCHWGTMLRPVARQVVENQDCLLFQLFVKQFCRASNVRSDILFVLSVGKRIPFNEILGAQRWTTKRNQEVGWGRGGVLSEDLEGEICVFNLRGDETLIPVINLWWVDFQGQNGQHSAEQLRTNKSCAEKERGVIEHEKGKLHLSKMLVYRIVSDGYSRCYCFALFINIMLQQWAVSKWGQGLLNWAIAESRIFCEIVSVLESNEIRQIKNEKKTKGSRNFLKVTTRVSEWFI